MTVSDWHRLPRRLRRIWKARLFWQWGVTLEDVACFYYRGRRISGVIVYLEDSTGRKYVEAGQVATRRLGRSHALATWSFRQ